jgi:cysteinyl-tRNA synthetase
MLAAISRVDSVLGVLKERKPIEITSEERRLIEIRQEARKRRDWKEADKIMSKLESMGIVLIDTPTGVKWQRKSESG